VVFVTTDPSRDSPPVIKHWLGEFTNAFSDPAFIGLTGSVALIHDAERQIDMPLSRATTNGDVVHAGYVLAYADDGIAHLLIDDTESPTDYTATLHSLITKGFRSA
jgi:protein SCO1/2